MTLSTHERVRLHWESLLDRLELDVDRTEALLAGGHVEVEPWTPPPPDFPLPAELATRAEGLLERQREVAARLEESLRDVRAQRAFTDKVERAAGPAPSGPRFVDVSA